MTNYKLMLGIDHAGVVASNTLASSRESTVFVAGPALARDGRCLGVIRQGSSVESSDNEISAIIDATELTRLLNKPA
jgi:hypothetical protein